MKQPMGLPRLSPNSNSDRLRNIFQDVLKDKSKTVWNGDDFEVIVAFVLKNCSLQWEHWNCDSLNSRKMAVLFQMILKCWCEFVWLSYDSHMAKQKTSIVSMIINENIIGYWLCHWSIMISSFCDRDILG